MKINRFFVTRPVINETDYVIEERELIHQWKNVFRMKAGEKLILMDGSGKEFYGDLKTISDDTAVVKIIEARESAYVPKKEIYLFSSLIKKDNYETVLQKCTEIGVSHFVPIVSSRTEKKDFNLERGKKIIREACEQSGRAVIPVLHEAKKLSEVFTLFASKNISFVAFDLHKENFDMKNFAEKKPIGIFIGPEGGWAEKDLEIFLSNNVSVFSLGNFPTFRAETAAIVASTIFLL